MKSNSNKFSRLFLLISLISLGGAGLVYVLHWALYGGLTAQGEFSVTGLMWCGGLALIFGLVAAAFDRSEKS